MLHLNESRPLRWAADHRLTLPKDLMLLWLTTGGGGLFESETILGPFADPVLADDVESVNDAARVGGLSTDYVIIHKGLGPFTA
jgi:hypothetical protein